MSTEENEEKLTLEELAKKKLQKDLEEENIEEENEEIVDLSRSAFIITREEAKRTYPKYSRKLSDCESPSELATQIQEILDEEEEARPPAPAPTGEVTLPLEQAIPTISPKKEWDSPLHMLNDLSHKMHFSRDPAEKAEAEKMYKELFRSAMIDNWKQKVRKLGKKGIPAPTELFECIRCGALNEDGAEFCMICKYKFGSGYAVPPNYSPSKLVKDVAK